MVNQRHLYELIHQGKSFSGHERNCCFANLGGKAFANVSAVSGFDFDDDGRAIALVDWDRDGDLDAWITNRTGPRLRAVINEGGTTADSHFLELLLEGVASNRDAVGAKVEISLSERGTKLRRTVTCGQGYLAQSSRWLHFGLGGAPEASSVTIQWPSGAKQELGRLEANRRYRIKEGEAPRQDALGPIPLRSAELATDDDASPAAPVKETAEDTSIRVALLYPLPLPKLEWRGPSGSTQSNWITEADGRPILLNLWSSSCRPCLEELSAWSALAQEGLLKDLRIVAVNADAITPGGDEAQARASWERIGSPFELGFATAELIDRLQIVCDALLARQRVMPAPSSFLISAQGDLLAIYQGKVSPPRLLADVSLNREADQIGAAAQQFPGQWLLQPKLDPALMVAKWIERGAVDASLEFFKRHGPRLVKTERYAAVHAQLGARLVEAKRWSEAEAAYREALAVKPDNPQALNDLGGILHNQGEHGDAIQLFREALRFDTHNSMVRMNLGMSLLADGALDEALKELETAAEDKTLLAPHRLLAETYRRMNRLPDALRHFEAIAEREPQSAEALMNLGAMQMQLRDVRRGTETLARAAVLDPQNSGIHKNLGMAYLMGQDFDRAATELETAVSLAPNDAVARFNLGLLRMKNEEWDGAVEHLRAAARLNPGDARYQRALQTAEQSSGKAPKE